MTYYGVKDANQLYLSQLELDMTLTSSKGYISDLLHAGTYTAVVILNVTTDGTSYEQHWELTRCNSVITLV